MFGGLEDVCPASNMASFWVSKKKSRGYQYLLTVISCFVFFLWVKHLSSKCLAKKMLGCLILTNKHWLLDLAKKKTVARISRTLHVWLITNICAMVKSRYIGDGHPTFNRNPYTWYIKPYYWVDEFIPYYMEIMGVRA